MAPSEYTPCNPSAREKQGMWAEVLDGGWKPWRFWNSLWIISNFLPLTKEINHLMSRNRVWGWR